MIKPEDLAGAWLVAALISAALVAGCSDPAPATLSETGTGGPAKGPAHRIIYQSERGGGVDVWVMNADGLQPANLTGNGALGYNDLVLFFSAVVVGETGVSLPPACRS